MGYGKPYKSPLRCSIAQLEREKVPKWGYSITEEELDSERTAKASARDVRVSHKAAIEVCRTIRNMRLTQAKRYLSDVIAKKKPVPYKRFKKKVGHKRGLERGAFAGRYPVKAADKILNLIKGAEANAENKGLDIERVKIIHASAYPGMKIKRFTPRAHGRSSPKFNTLCHIEIVLEEKLERGEV